jgi:hypothetical protein
VQQFRTLQYFAVPPDLLPGSLTTCRTRCDKPNGHCAQGEGHEAWGFTFTSQRKQVPAKATLSVILLAQILRESSFYALESSVGSGRGRSLA